MTEENKKKPPQHTASGTFAEGNIEHKKSARNKSLRQNANKLRLLFAKFLIDEGGAEKLIWYAKNGEANISKTALESIVGFVMPKLVPQKLLSPEDLDEEEKKRLAEVLGLPVEQQAQKTIELYITGVIDCGIASTLNELIKSAQHIHDEELERRLVELEKNKSEEK
jgi:hypothetical protein